MLKFTYQLARFENSEIKRYVYYTYEQGLLRNQGLTIYLSTTFLYSLVDKMKWLLSTIPYYHTTKARKLVSQNKSESTFTEEMKLRLQEN